MESRRWYYKVWMSDGRGVQQAESAMNDLHFRNVRVVEAGIDAVDPVAYGQFIETEDDDVESQDEAVGDHKDVSGWTRSSTPFKGGRAPKAPKLPPARKPSASQCEQAQLLGMEFGVDAYNEAMGYA